jgi:hypothetical protein
VDLDHRQEWGRVNRCGTVSKLLRDGVQHRLSGVERTSHLEYSTDLGDRMTLRTRWHIARATSIGAAVLAGAVGIGGRASAAPTRPSTLPAHMFASATASATNPDDITLMHDQVFVGFANGVGPDGAPGPLGPNSTVVEYNKDGSVAHTFSLTGKVDGLTADPHDGRLIVTVNEDLNSSIYVLRPDADPTAQVVHYSYDPSPAQPASSPPPPTAGGTDSIAISHGHIFVTHSNPAQASSPATYEVTLDPGSHVAHLRPVFADNATATDAVTNQKVTLALTDPDSSRAMPSASPRFAGQLAQVSQADGEVVFVDHPSRLSPTLSRLDLSNSGSPSSHPPVDDIAVATADRGTLYVTDPKAGTVTALSTAGLPAGTVFAAEASDTKTPLVGTLDLATGVITPLGNTFTNPHGLLFVPEGQHQNDDDHPEGED